MLTYITTTGNWVIILSNVTLATINNSPNLLMDRVHGINIKIQK